MIQVISDFLGEAIQSQWLTTLSLVLTPIALFLVAVKLIRFAQRLGIGNVDEEFYLKSLIEFVRQLHVRGTFEESFFVEREFRLADRYQPRSFFLASHRSGSNRAGMGSLLPGEAPPSTEGYYTSDLMGEAVGAEAPVIILGEPGSGKSVSARQLALEAARQQLRVRRPDGRLPIFVSLSEFTACGSDGKPASFFAFLKDLLGNRGGGNTMPSAFLEGELERLLDSGRILLVLDSVDEMPPAHFALRCARLVEFMAQHASNRFVLTCRSTEFAGQIQGREAYLDRLRPKEIYQLIKRRAGQLGEWTPKTLYRTLTSPDFALAPFISNPFYLNLILYYTSFRKDLPDNIPVLLSGVCKDWADREITRKEGTALELPKLSTPDEIAQILIDRLADIAFAISNSAGFGTYLSLHDLEPMGCEWRQDAAVGAWVLDVAQRGEMLEVDRKRGNVRFVHHKFQEYFAAVYLDRAFATGLLPYSDLPFICDNIWWDEVIAILASITRHPEEIIQCLLQNPPEHRPEPADESAKPLLEKLPVLGVKFSDENPAGPSHATDAAAQTPGPIFLERSGQRPQRHVLPLSYCWIMARCLRLLPVDAPSRNAMVGLVLKATVIRLAGNPAVGIVVDCVRAFSEIEDERAVEALVDRLPSRSKFERELAFAGLGRTQLGREYLARNVHEIGVAVYLKRRFGVATGRHARSIRTVLFPNWKTQAILRGYALLGLLSQYRFFMITLSLTLFPLFCLLGNVYAMLLVSGLLLWDLGAARMMPTVPTPADWAFRLPKRALFLMTLAVFLLLGCLTPPYLILPSFLGVFVANEVLALGLIVVIIAWSQRKSKNVSYGIRLWQALKMLISEASNKWEMVFQRVKQLQHQKINPTEEGRVMEIHVLEAQLRLGFINAEKFVREMAAYEEGWTRLVERLKSDELGEKSLEVLDAMENLERQMVQAGNPPKVLDLIHIRNLFAAEMDAASEPRRSAAVMAPANSTPAHGAKKIYVSYAWGDDTAEGLERERVVNEQCTRLRAKGYEVIIDKEANRPGDWISKFMRAIGSARKVLVVLSDKYLRSPYCMEELYLVYKSSNEDKATFLGRIQLVVLGNLRIDDPKLKKECYEFWNHKLQEQREFIGALGSEGHKNIETMQHWVIEMPNMLTYLADTNHCKDFSGLGAEL